MPLNRPQSFADRQFLTNSEIPDDALDLALRLSEKEKRLFDMIFADSLNEAIQSALAENISASFQIENEYLDSEVVKSFVISSMGMKVTDWMETDWTEGEVEAGFVPAEQRAVESIMACLNSEPLDDEMIFRVNGLACGECIRAYRNHPEVVRAGKRIIYEAPEHERLPELMAAFIAWWNKDRIDLPASVGAAIAHYNFVAIHPFRDGNGRTARALAEKALITSQETIFRPYSLSTQILREKAGYYAALQTGDPIIFIRYMLNIHERAIDCGIKEAQRLGFLRLFLKRDNFSEDEKKIISQISTAPAFNWRPNDFFLIKNNEEVFNRLKLKGVITGSGTFNMAYRPAQ